MKNKLKIILLSSAFNGLTQRAWLYIKKLQHDVSIILFTTEEEVINSIETANPDLVICPFLKDRVPKILWENEKRPIVIIHPGIMGDRGASALDWTIMNHKTSWGVTALQAVEEMDAGPIWSSHNFEVPAKIRKSTLYNNEVSDAAIKCISDIINNFILNKKPIPLDYSNPSIKGNLQPNMKQADRYIDWKNMTAEEILTKINTAEGVPGVLTKIEGEDFYVYDAYLSNEQGTPGSLLAKRDDAILIATADKSLWIGSLKPYKKGEKTFKYPATEVLNKKVASLKDLSQNLNSCILPLDEYSPIHYSQKGKIGIIDFNFYNGAMSTKQCERMCSALQFAKNQDISILLLRGGINAFSNGIHLNTIEAASNPGEEAWKNIQAIDDVCLEILEAKQFVISAITGSAGAGGAMLALAADYVMARDGIVLNPHYATMGLYGSEYWTYTLPRRVGKDLALKLTQDCLPISTEDALGFNMIDEIGPRKMHDFDDWLINRVISFEKNKLYKKLSYDKKLAHECRENELSEMKKDLLDDRNNFSVKRRNFVNKEKSCRTPDRLIADWAIKK